MMLRGLLTLALLLVPVHSWAAITYVRAGGTADATAAASHNITVPAAGHAAGNLVVVSVAMNADPGATTFTDTTGVNTWNVTINYWDAGDVIGVVVAWSVLTQALVSGNTITYDPTNSTDANIASHEYTSDNGFVTSADTSDTNSAAYGTTWGPDTLTPTSGRSALIASAASTASGATNTASANWTERDERVSPVSANRGLIVQDRIIASTSGSYAGTIGTRSASTDTDSGHVVLLENTAGAAVARNLLLMGVGQ